MVDNVTILPVITSLPIPVDRVLDIAPRDLDEVLVIGFDKDGGFYFAASEASGPTNLWLLQSAIKALMEARE